MSRGLSRSLGVALALFVLGAVVLWGRKALRGADTVEEIVVDVVEEITGGGSE
jgi:hypothetical protein